MSENAINGSVAGEVLEGRAMAGAEHDDAGVVLGSLGENLNGRVAVHDVGLDNGTAGGGCIRGKDAQLMQRGRVSGWRAGR